MTAFSYKKYSSLIHLLVLFVAIGGIILFAILPINQSLDAKMRGIQEFYADQENQKKQVSRLPELKDQYTVIVENEPVLHILITEDQIVDFIKTLEGLADDMDVQMTITSKDNGRIIESKKIPVKAVSVTDDDTNASASTASTKPQAVNIVDDVPFNRYLRLNIKAEGQYADIVAFLRKIETLPIGLDVVGVEIKTIDVSANKNAAPPVTTNNPFAFLGDGSVVSRGGVSSITEKNALEATFDILVYVNDTN
ncbi:MAG: hypothetical protein WAV46_00925 [Candidatus Moraniibacteriota bacterium]